MGLLEKITHFGMTKQEWDESMLVTDAEIYSDRAMQQYGFDLANGVNLKVTDKLNKKLKEAEKLGLDCDIVYDNYFHGIVLNFLGRTHSDCHRWYTQPVEAV